LARVILNLNPCHMGPMDVFGRARDVPERVSAL